MQQSSMLFQEVGVVVSILLGFAPPSTFFVASSSKVLEIISDVQFLLHYSCYVILLDDGSGAHLIFNLTYINYLM